ncbi:MULTISPECIES: hypothetical protein [Rhizobium]|uniref:hypothetical protein n=1 Tax=Rhizobium TaxID=379 RepID=UPI000F96F4B7
MIADRMKPVLFAVALVSASASIATARDPSPDFNSSQNGYRGHHYGHGHHGRRGELKLFSDQRLGGASRVVSSTRSSRFDTGSIQQLGSYATVSGTSIIYSNGYREIYVGQYASEPSRPTLSYPAPKAKIITVTQELADGSFRPVSGCSYEMGVCVIRGDR